MEQSGESQTEPESSHAAQDAGRERSSSCQILLRSPIVSESPAPPDYVARVNRAIDHIVQGLDRPLNLERVAEVACFSPFHFHRVFRALIGETVHEFVTRQRLERALFLMSHDRGRSLTDVAHGCGFASSSDFSRAFKKRYGVPPSAIDVDTYRRKNRGRYEDHCRIKGLPAGENPDGFAARVRSLPERTMAYIRVLDPYQPDRVTSAAERLMEWADGKGALDNPWYGYMWDDPEIVALKDCRYDVAVELDDFSPEGEIGRIRFPPMTVAEVELRGSIELEQRAIDWLFRSWLPSSGYLPSDQPAFEAWIGRPFAHGLEHFELRAQLPVER